ncbi:MAG: hypothetical protein ACFFDW_06680 [Candidatus Thorarchaeota archaeon]
MIKNLLLQRKIVSIITDRYSNWEEKSYFISKMIEGKEKGEEILVKLIESHKNLAVRKGVASVLGYMKLSHLSSWMIDQIFKEKDWTVRFALARSVGATIGSKGVSELQKKFHEKLNELTNFNEQQRAKISYVESLGAMNFTEGNTILTDMLLGELQYSEQTSFELINQIIYNLGEIGDEVSLNILINFSPKLNSLNSNIQKSLSHSLNKIAQRMGYSSYSDYLNKETQK